MKKPDASVGIVTKNRWELCISLLCYLLQRTSLFREVVLIDNSFRSPMEILYFFEDRFRKERVSFKYYKCPFITSIFELRQLLLKEVTYKYLLMLDDDIILFKPNLLEVYWEKVDTSFGFLQGTKVDYQNCANYLDWGLYRDTIQFVEDIPLWYYFYSEQAWVPTVHLDTGYCLIDREKALEVGGFACQEDFDANEDVLLGARLASKYSCYYCSFVTALHIPRAASNFSDKNPLRLLEVADGISPLVRDKLRRFYEKKFSN